MGKTRSKTVDVVVGQPAGLPNRQLPTKLDVLKAYLFKLNLSACDDKEVKCEIYSDLVDEIENIWKMASLPPTNKDLILKNVQYLVQKYSSFSHSLNSKRDNKGKIDLFLSELSYLFDVCSCPCFKSKFGKLVDWNNVKSTDCFCVSLGSKIPETEWNFYVDQQLNRQLFISNSVDKTASEQLRKRKLKIDNQKEREKRKREYSSEVARPESAQDNVPIELSKLRQLRQDSHGEFPCDSFSLHVEDGHELDEDYKSEVIQNRTEYPNQGLEIAAARRFGISNRAVCVLGNAMLKDLGRPILISINSFFFIDYC